MSYPRGITFLLLIFCPSLTFAQDTTKTNDRAETTDQAPEVKRSDYVASAFERFLLGWQYQYQRVEQPDFVLVTQPGNTQLLSPNPESHLNQHSFTYDFGQVFLTPAQLANARKLNTLNTLNTNLFCSGKDSGNDRGNDPVTCLARAGSPKRFLSGIKITANISEHPVVVQGSILPAGYLYGGQVDFDPTKLFTTGTDWKTITSTISDPDKSLLRENPKVKRCDVTLPGSKDKDADTQEQINTVNCAKDLLAYRGLTPHKKLDAILSFMTPTFQYKRLTPFDFLKYAGTLIPSSNSRGLNSWSITVDARRLIASPTSRLDAINAAAAIRPKAAAVKLCGLIFKGGSLSIISVPGDTQKESCLETAKAIHAEKYELGCSGGKDTVLGPPEPVDLPVPTSALPSTEGGTASCWGASDRKDGASEDLGR